MNNPLHALDPDLLSRPMEELLPTDHLLLLRLHGPETISFVKALRFSDRDTLLDALALDLPFLLANGIDGPGRAGKAGEPFHPVEVPHPDPSLRATLADLMDRRLPDLSERIAAILNEQVPGRPATDNPDRLGVELEWAGPADTLPDSPQPFVASIREGLSRYGREVATEDIIALLIDHDRLAHRFCRQVFCLVLMFLAYRQGVQPDWMSSQAKRLEDHLRSWHRELRAHPFGLMAELWGHTVRKIHDLILRSGLRAGKDLRLEVEIDLARRTARGGKERPRWQWKPRHIVPMRTKGLFDPMPGFCGTEHYVLLRLDHADGVSVDLLQAFPSLAEIREFLAHDLPFLLLGDLRDLCREDDGRCDELVVRFDPQLLEGSRLWKVIADWVKYAMVYDEDLEFKRHYEGLLDSIEGYRALRKKHRKMRLTLEWAGPAGFLPGTEHPFLSSIVASMRSELGRLPTRSELHRVLRLHNTMSREYFQVYKDFDRNIEEVFKDLTPHDAFDLAMRTSSDLSAWMRRTRQVHCPFLRQHWSETYSRIHQALQPYLDYFGLRGK